MACSAPKNTLVDARTSADDASAGAPSSSSFPSANGIRNPRKKASSPTPAPSDSAKTPGRPSGAMDGSTPALKISRTSPSHSYFSSCVIANASVPRSGSVHSDAWSTLHARIASRTSGWTPRNDAATCEPTPMRT
eukprot:31434-Pelagococcus_subviridis.AAC.16